MGTRWYAVIMLAVATVIVPQRAFAQRTILEGHAGRSWFLDESAIPHAVVAGGARLFVTPRIAIGPEVTFMNGPDTDEDWFLTGNATIDIGPLEWQSRVMPYAVAGGGIMRHSRMIGPTPFSSREGTVTFGGGARIALGPRLFVAPEFRMGWEPHWRPGVSVGLIR